MTTLLDVFPRLTADNGADSHVVNPELFCKLSLGCATFSVLASYFPDISFSECRHVVFRTMLKATLGNSVMNVLKLRSEEQMIRANACTIVTVMTHDYTIRDWSVVQHPGCPMGEGLPVCFASKAEGSIPIGHDVALPFPAFTNDFNLGHESLVHRLAATTVRTATARTESTTTLSDVVCWCQERLAAVFTSARDVTLEAHRMLQSFVATLRAVPPAPGLFVASILPCTSQIREAA